MKKQLVYKTALEQVIKELAGMKYLDFKAYVADTGLEESGIYKMFNSGSARASSLEKLARPLGLDPLELQHRIKSMESNFTGNSQTIRNSDNATANFNSGHGNSASFGNIAEVERLRKELELKDEQIALLKEINTMLKHGK